MAGGGKGHVRLVSRTVDKSGRVAFDQVVLEDAEATAGVLFAAVEPERGLSVWVRP
jgi:hypothetical protein